MLLPYLSFLTGDKTSPSSKVNCPAEELFQHFLPEREIMSIDTTTCTGTIKDYSNNSYGSAGVGGVGTVACAIAIVPDDGGPVIQISSMARPSTTTIGAKITYKKNTDTSNNKVTYTL